MHNLQYLKLPCIILSIYFFGVKNCNSLLHLLKRDARKVMWAVNFYFLVFIQYVLSHIRLDFIIDSISNKASIENKRSHTA